MALHLFYEIPMHFLQIQMILSLTARHIYQDRRSQASNGHPPKKWGRRYEINGAGRLKREAVPEMMRSYITGRTITPEYVKRTKVEAVVPDSAVKVIIDGLNEISPGKEAHGMIFVRDVSDAYELGTKVSGEAALSAK
jgi:nitrogen regulatory protein P-II 1